MKSIGLLQWVAAAIVIAALLLFGSMANDSLDNKDADPRARDMSLCEVEAEAVALADRAEYIRVCKERRNALSR